MHNNLITLGVEEEFFIVDANGQSTQICFDKLFKNQAIVARTDFFDEEMHVSTIETKTDICNSVQALIEDIDLKRSLLKKVLLEQNAYALRSSTHPLDNGVEFINKSNAYFEDLIHKYQYAILDNYICGMHVHIGLPNGTDTDLIYLFNSLIDYIPELLALSANSPYWKGEFTGILSYRSLIWKRLLGTGLPFEIENLKDYVEYFKWLHEKGCNPGPLSIWFDMRVHPVYNTVEIRVTDLQKNIQNIRAIVGYIKAVASYILTKKPIFKKRTIKQWRILEENKYRAARFGTNAVFVRESDPDVEVKQKIGQFIANHSNLFENTEDILALNNLLTHGCDALSQVSTLGTTDIQNKSTQFFKNFIL